MQQNIKCKWLRKSFVFLLSILVATSFMVPGSLGAFGAQEARAAEPTVLDDMDWLFITDDGEITEFHKEQPGCPKDIIIPRFINKNGTDIEVKKIGDGAFSGATLNSVQFGTATAPSAIREIGVEAFKGNRLGNVALNLPTTLETMGRAAFQDAGRISTLDMSNLHSLKEIPASAFEITNVTTIKLPKYVTKIGRAAFSETFAKGTIVVPKETSQNIEIGNWAFGVDASCLIDMSAYKPNEVAGAPWGVSTKGTVKWSDARNINNSKNPDVVAKPTLASTKTPFEFDTESGLIYGLKDDLAAATTTDTTYDGWKKSTGELEIPEKIGDIPVTGFADGFVASAKTSAGGNNSRAAIKKITFTGTHTMDTLPWCAFFHTGNLQEINNIPASIETIKYGAFMYCRGLKQLVFPAVKEVENSAFSVSDTGTLKSVEFQGKSLTTIGSTAFWGTPATLTEIKIPEKEKDTVTGAPWGALYATVYWANGTTLTDVQVTDDLKWKFSPKEKRIYQYLPSLGKTEDTYEDIIVPNKVKIGGTEYDVKIVGYDGSGLFEGANLDEYERGKSGVKNVVISEGITELANAFNNTVISGDITLPSTLTKLTGYAFGSCKLDAMPKLPVGITTIGDRAFNNNPGITGIVTIPGNVTSMHERSFLNCPNITGFDIRMYKDQPTDDGAYSETPPRFKKAHASNVVNKAPFGAPNVGANNIVYRDTPAPVPQADVTTNATDNTATITFRGYVSTSALMVKEFTKATNMPEFSNIRYQTTGEDGTVGPTSRASSVDMVVKSKTADGKLGGNGVYTVDMKFGAKNDDSDKRDYPYSKSLNVFHTLTYDINAGNKPSSGAAPTAGDVFVKDYEVTLAGQGAMSVPGYKFSGWTVNKNGSGTVLKPGTKYKMPDKNTTLYAKWDVNNVKTTFNANGGTFGSSPTKDVTAQEGKLLSEVIGTNPTRTGYRLAGWASKNNATKPDETVVGASTKIVYAVWDANDVRVTYNANGGEVGGEPSVVRDGKVGATISNIPTATNTKRTGYTFDGWYTQKTGGTKVTATTFPNANAEYYAHWNPNKNTVKFAANPEGTTSQKDVTVLSGQPVGVTPTAEPNDPTQYRFENRWICDADGGNGTVYTSEQVRNYIVSGAKNPVTFTAVFTPINKSMVFYNYNGGVDADGAMFKQFIGEIGTAFISSSEVPKPELTGYTLSWDPPTKPTVYPGQSLTITAVWTPKDNAVNFVVPNGTADPEGKTVKSGQPVGVSPKAEVDLGYKFNGQWVNSVDNKNYLADQIADYKVSGEHPEITFTAQVSERPDWFALDAAIQEGEAKIAGEEKDKYTETSVQALEQALEAAKEVLNDPASSDGQLQAEKEAVDAAVKALKTKEQQQADDALAKAKSDSKAELDAKNVNLYEEPELSVVKKAIEDGKKEIDASTTIPQVDAAKKKALDTIAAQKTAAQKQAERDAEQKETEDPKNIPTEVTDKTPANLVAVTTAITTAKNDGDLKGSTYAPLKFMSKKQTKKNIKLQWSKVKGAKQYTVYANQCGTKNKYKKLATVKGKTLNVKKVAGKKLKKGVSYKFLIIAENGDKVSAISKTLHIRTAGHKKYTNYKSVSVNKTVIKKAKKLKKGKTLKLNAKGVVPKGKKVSVHVKTRYESSNKKVATVTKAGKVKGIKKGKAKIYCYVQNGLAKVVTVTVK